MDMEDGLTLVEMTHETSESVCLLQSAFANFDDVRKIHANLSQELAAYAGFTCEKSEQGILALRCTGLRFAQTLMIKEVRNYPKFTSSIMRTSGREESHDWQCWRSDFIQSGCCVELPCLDALEAGASSSSSPMVRILRSLPRSAFPTHNQLTSSLKKTRVGITYLARWQSLVQRSEVD